MKKPFSNFAFASLALLSACGKPADPKPDTATVLTRAARDAFEAKCTATTSQIDGIQVFLSGDYEKQIIVVNDVQVGEINRPTDSEPDSMFSSNLDVATASQLSPAQKHTLEYATRICVGLAASPNLDTSTAISVPVLPPAYKTASPAARALVK